jgi:hypothetical protein
MEERCRVCFLEGASGIDYELCYETLEEAGYDMYVLDGLYDDPTRIKKLEDIEPECLFIGTTPFYADKKKILINHFERLDYKPKYIMVFNEDGLGILKPKLREMQALGVDIYIAPYCHISELRKIDL